jgi:hypothetical protein
MASRGGQPKGHGMAGVIGVGDEIDWHFDAERLDQREEFLGQGPLVAVTEHEPLVDPRREWHREKVAAAKTRTETT